MEYTTYFELHSQATRLLYLQLSLTNTYRTHTTGVSPSTLPLSIGLGVSFCIQTLQALTLHLWPCGQILDLGLAFHFTRRYYGNHCYFLFLRLLRCFNSAGVPYFNWGIYLIKGFNILKIVGAKRFFYKLFCSINLFIYYTFKSIYNEIWSICK